MEDEDKYWKLSPADLKERQYWNDYTQAYEEALSQTGNNFAPWVIVPANDKKIARAIVAHIIADAIETLKIEFPKLSKDKIDELLAHKEELLKEKQ